MSGLDFDIIVVGGGHAGCEAALAAARMGAATAMLTMNLDSIARMSCNPAIGGLAKGQLVREIDALGGEMARVIDATGIQFRMINTGKGPAMHSPRAQADRSAYHVEMKRRLEAQDNLALHQALVAGLVVEDGRVRGVRTVGGDCYRADAVVLATGTFLNGLLHLGPAVVPGGRMGEPPAHGLSESLRAAGLTLSRFKTDTPPRVNGRTVDWDALQPQYGDPEPHPFSFATERIQCEQVPCHQTWTNPTTHAIILGALDRAPLYDGQIKAGLGPRYCPSIEIKVLRFPDRDHHLLFLEPEGRNTHEVYCNGLFTSLPGDVQEDVVHSIAGMERAQIMRYGYAVEYDWAPPTQLRLSLETKRVASLFHAGQINGTSGYEEAAAQGLIAGVNAARNLAGKEPIIIGRDEGYVGVLIDDLVTKGTAEPYRMFTSLAEYRLCLRQDNADRRLMGYGHENGLVSDADWSALEAREHTIQAALDHLHTTWRDGRTLAQILSRPDAHLESVVEAYPRIADLLSAPHVRQQVEIEVKYEGYLQRQRAQIQRFRRDEGRRIPDHVDYRAVPQLRVEARERLAAVQPQSLGQAARVSGVSPADVATLLIYIEGLRGPAAASGSGDGP
jgi:tRNA uridine 5-carboxymethylaminomethyl modification enzyme